MKGNASKRIVFSPVTVIVGVVIGVAVFVVIRNSVRNDWMEQVNQLNGVSGNFTGKLTTDFSDAMIQIDTSRLTQADADALCALMSDRPDVIESMAVDLRGQQVTKPAADVMICIAKSGFARLFVSGYVQLPPALKELILKASPHAVIVN